MNDHAVSTLAAAQAAKSATLSVLVEAMGTRSEATIGAFLAQFNQLPAFSAYRYLPAEARNIHARVEQASGPTLAKHFLYCCMLQAMIDSLQSTSFRKLPQRVQGHQLTQFLRIVSNADSIIATCDIDADLFLKDLGLALLRLYAAAAQLIDFRSGLGRTTLLRGGWRDVVRRLGIFHRIGGFKPFFEIHTHLAYLDEFNEAGWNECYRCCSELYERHPKVLGMSGTSWFYDPVLADISPRLAYLRELPQAHGAYCLFESANEQSANDATSTSPSRRALYQAGKYKPAVYALIWPREAQMAWYAADEKVSKGVTE